MSLDFSSLLSVIFYQSRRTMGGPFTSLHFFCCCSPPVPAVLTGESSTPRPQRVYNNVDFYNNTTGISLSLSLTARDSQLHTKRRRRRRRCWLSTSTSLGWSFLKREQKIQILFSSLSLSLNGDVVGVKRRGREREASSSIDGVL